MAERDLPKVEIRVRFPLPAPRARRRKTEDRERKTENKYSENFTIIIPVLRHPSSVFRFALVAQWIECLLPKQKVARSSRAEGTIRLAPLAHGRPFLISITLMAGQNGRWRIENR